jgi:hypothetical protein
MTMRILSQNNNYYIFGSTIKNKINIFILFFVLLCVFNFNLNKTEAITTSNIYPSAYVNTTGFNYNFSTPGNVYIDDSNYATMSAGRNKGGATLWTGFDFSSIPSGSTINSVNVYVKGKVSASWSQGTWSSSVWPDVTISAALTSGTTGAFNNASYTTTTTNTTENTWNYTLTGTLPTDSELKALNFGVRVEGANGNNGTTHTWSINDIYIIVDYTVSTSPSLSSTTTTTSITQTSASSGGTISSDGGATITTSGVVWNTTGTPTVADSKTTDGATSGTFVSSITGLTCNTTYYVRAYATNSVGTGYATQVSFTTSACNVIPTVTTPTVTSIGINGAILGANVTSLGIPASISERGTCWGTTANPITNCIAEGNTTTGIFTHVRTGMTAETLYYYRGYATNTTGTAYSADGTFTTQTLPTVTLPTKSAITDTTATLGATLTSPSFTVTARGTCWGTSSNPTTNCLSDGTTTGAYTQARTGLTTGTLYYYRGYTTYTDGAGVTSTIYSADDSFTTLTIPILSSTTDATSITQTSASSGGTISSDGGATITTSGVVWNTTGTPTVADSKTTDGATSGTFVSSITGLTCNTTYYVRAYATNSVGTGYGNQVSFTTLDLPTVTTQAVSNIAPTTVTGNGTVVSDGNSTIIERGFVWKTSMDPTINDNKLVISGTTGSFNGSITGLTQNTLYYVRAYATNSVGTNYGVNDAFITSIAQTSPTIVLNTADTANLGSDTTPTLEMTATDINNDNVQYNIQISTDSSFPFTEKWVAVGDVTGTSSIAHSSDGISWTGDGKTIFSIYGYTVAYNGTMWVAAGSGTNSLAYSYNGIDWTGLGTSIFSEYGYGIAWNGTMWVATGGGTNSLAYSYNGIDWTGLGTTIFSITGYNLAWNGSLWVATGHGTNSIAYSSNGTSWTAVSGSSSIFSSYGRAVAWNGSLWVAGGVGTNTLAYSSNGTSWTGEGLVFSSSVTGIAWNGSIFVAVGNDTTNSIAYSSNGTSWTGVTGKTIFSSWGKGVAWNGEKFVATGQGISNSFAYSSDGISWTGTGITDIAIPNAVASNNPVSLVPSIAAPISGLDKISSTDVGFLNTINGSDTQPFNSGEKVSYTVQEGSELTPGTYYWRARTIDPSGTNTYSSWTTVRSFTISNLYTQSAYKFFGNIDSADIGSDLATQDNSISLNRSGEVFRLRTLVHVGIDLALNAQSFKLQFAQKNGQCDTAFVGETYSDVTNDTAIAYYNNFYPEDGIALINNNNDPIHSVDTIINQTYVESNNFSNSISNIEVGQDGKWDFSLYDKGVGSSISYCFRIVKSDDSLLDVYSVIPEITTAIYRSRGGGGGNIENAITPDAPVTGGGQGGGDHIVLPQCSDTLDNNEDTLIDDLDPNCHLDGVLNNTYIPSHDSETTYPVMHTEGVQGGGGGMSDDLGYIKNIFKSIFNSKSFKNSLFGLVFNPYLVFN